MSRYIISNCKLEVPTAYCCPNCKKKVLTSIKLVGEGKSIVDVRHRRADAESIADSVARQTVLSQLEYLYSTDQVSLSKLVSGKCPECGKVLPWSETETEKKYKVIGNVMLYLELALFVVTTLWSCASVSTGEFGPINLILLLVTVGVFFLLCLVDKKTKPNVEQQEQIRVQNMSSVPAECLPTLVMPKEVLLGKVNNHS